MSSKTQQQKTLKQPKLRFPGFSGGWEEKKLGEISEINPSTDKLPDEFFYIDLESVEKGQLKQENKIKKESAPSRAQRVLKRYDILFQTVRPYQKNNLLFNLTGNYVASTGYAQIRTEENPQFLYQYLHTDKFLNNVLAKCTGSNYPAINGSDVKQIKVKIPVLSEQQKISGFLGVVDEWIENLKKQKESLESYKKGLMQKIFSQEIRFKQEDGKELSKWEEKRLGDCLDYEQPTNYIVKSTEYDKNYKTPVLTAGKTFILGYTDEITGVFQKNDLPVIIFDDFTTTSQFVDFPFKVKSSAMKILKAKHGINIKFIFEAMRQIKYEIGGHGRHWISKYSNIKLYVPSFPEQEKIAEFLTSVDNIIKSKQQQITQVEQWKKGLMQGLFV